MRRLGACALMMSLCLLAACGGGRGGEDADQLALDLRGRYLALSGCTARLELTADYGERVYEYGLDLSYQREGDTTLTVTAPEGAAGVTARISGDETFLEYDGASLETGPLDESGLSPMGAVMLMFRCAREGFIAESGMEEVGEGDSLLRFTCRDPEAGAGEGTEVTLWASPETYALVRGEVSVDGARVVGCTFEDMAMEMEGTEQDTWTEHE